MKLSDLTPTDTADYGAERLFIAGQSGSGKSTLMQKIIAAIPPTRDSKGEPHGWCVVVIDSKQDWQYRRIWQRGPGASRYRPLPVTDLRLVPDGYYVYRPKSFPERSDSGAQRIFRTALQRKYCVIVVDELADFGTGGIPALGKLIRQGRAKHCIIIAGTQRPSGITLLAITEANKLICFGLGSRDDYDRVAKWGDSRFMQPPSGEHDFNFYDRRARRFVRVQQAA